MTSQERKTLLQVVKQRFLLISDYLSEVARRRWAAAEALTIGRHGIAIVAEATGLSRTTITRGKRELDAEPLDADRQRAAGGGRKRLADSNPQLLKDLDRLINPSTRGDPESSLRWTCKSTYQLAEALGELGHTISQRSVYRLLQESGYSLQKNRKMEEGTDHADRDEQFQFIADKVQRFQRQGQPVISVDTKKKENIGNYGNSGQEWHSKGEPRRVKTHDFRSKDEVKASPYGIYDLTENNGWVNVGISHDTAQFAVASIRGWWRKMGQDRYPRAKKLLITADGGGSNGYRTRLWKVEVQKLATQLRMPIHVCHFPPGTSKWNKIEHRMFSFISKNWRGRPLDSLATIVNLISNTTTKEGLFIEASLDYETYDKGIQVSDEEMEQLHHQGEKFHSEWNYLLKPVL